MTIHGDVYRDARYHDHNLFDYLELVAPVTQPTDCYIAGASTRMYAKVGL